MMTVYLVCIIDFNTFPMNLTRETNFTCIERGINCTSIEPATVENRTTTERNLTNDLSTDVLWQKVLLPFMLILQV